MASAVRSAARALGHSPEQLPADPRLLGKRLAEVAPQSLGLVQARWNNIRSLFRASLKLVTPVAPGRHNTPFTPAWKALWVRLEEQTLKTRLSRLLHFCSIEGIEPEAVNQVTFEAFREYLGKSLLKNPPIVYRACISAWNAARAAVPGWPGFTVEFPSGRTDGPYDGRCSRAAFARTRSAGSTGSPDATCWRSFRFGRCGRQPCAHGTTKSGSSPRPWYCAAVIPAG